MALLDEQADRRRHAADVVEADGRGAARAGRQVDDGRAVALHGGQVPGHGRLQLGVTDSAAGEDDDRGAHAAQQPDVRLLALGDAVAAAGDDEEAGVLRGVLHAAHDLGEVGIGDVMDDDTHDRDAALEQPAGQRIRHEIEGLGGGEDALAGRLADRVVRSGQDS